jgi:DNA adenine methylase
MLFEDRINGLVLVELDQDVSAVWQTILNGQGIKLADRISGFRVTEASVKSVLDASPQDLFDRAFSTLIKNRMNRGGILAPGASLLKKGENGRGLLSRWYPQTLHNRISAITSLKTKIRFHYGDGIAWMENLARSANTVFFIDPPYTVAGKRLYRHSEIDHERLFQVASTLRGDFLMTYDEAEPIKELARKNNFETHTLLMKNTHHRIMRELLVGKDLGWARSSSRKFGQDLLLELG